VRGAVARRRHPGVPQEAFGNGRPREMITHDKIRLIDRLLFLSKKVPSPAGYFPSGVKRP
jgi:hypothetical protein